MKRSKFAGLKKLSPLLALPMLVGWAANDEIGNANTLGYNTRARCALHVIDPRAEVYELSHIFSPTMPQSPFGDAPVSVDYKPTVGIPYTKHAGNGEVLTAGFGSQGTQMDALGHFGYLEQPWFGDTAFPANDVKYYNGYTQAQVKPSATGGLQKLGIEKVPPIITSAVMLDAARLRNRTLFPGELITATDIDAMLGQAGLASRGILRGDAVYIHTGWGQLFVDGNTTYYSEGPGLSVDAQEYLAAEQIVLVALDNPFTDPVKACQFAGTCAPPAGTAPFLPFNVHHNNLTKDGIYQIQNLRLTELAANRVSLSCTMVLPLRLKGGAGSAVRPIAIGATRQ